MKKEPTLKIDKKEKLLERLKDIQSKINNLENQRAEKIGKFAKKFRLFDLSDELIEKEFSFIKDKYFPSTNTMPLDSAKKN